MKDKRINILLVVGDATSIFVENFAKWLKAKCNCTVDVFQFRNYENRLSDCPYFDNLECSATIIPTFFNHRIVWRLKPDYQKYCLWKFLRGKKYDVIQCHWLINETVYCADLMKKHTSCLASTFWGGELTTQNINGSQDLYLRHLSNFIEKVDCLINSKGAESKFTSIFPMLKKKYKYGNLGAVGLDHLASLMEDNRRNSKRYFGIPDGKLSVQIAYSGKELHRHIPIIEELSKHLELKEKIHLINPMTRDVMYWYVSKVDKALEDSGFTYTTVQGRSLTDEEISKLRHATDIVLQFSEFDGFSRSIVEALCAKSLVIYGEWLEYETRLAIDGFEAIETATIEDGIKKLSYAVDHMDEYKLLCENNSHVGFSNYQWKNCIDDWINIYKTF